MTNLIDLNIDRFAGEARSNINFRIFGEFLLMPVVERGGWHLRMDEWMNE